MNIGRSIPGASALAVAIAAIALGAAPPARAADKPAPRAADGILATIAPDSLPTATPALREAARRGEVRAQFDLAMAMACGRGTRRDLPAAAQWFGKAADQGHAGAKSVLGWMHMTGKGAERDPARARALIREAAEAGDVAAQNNLGVIYAQGVGVPVDAAEAEKWFRRAAAQGALDAARNLELLRDGRNRTAQPTQVLPEFRT